MLAKQELRLAPRRKSDRLHQMFPAANETLVKNSAAAAEHQRGNARFSRPDAADGGGSSGIVLLCSRCQLVADMPHQRVG
jgi:hypothetical protein